MDKYLVLIKTDFLDYGGKVYDNHIAVTTHKSLSEACDIVEKAHECKKTDEAITTAIYKSFLKE